MSVFIRVSNLWASSGTLLYTVNYLLGYLLSELEKIELDPLLFLEVIFRNLARTEKHSLRMQYRL